MMPASKMTTSITSDIEQMEGASTSAASKPSPGSRKLYFENVCMLMTALSTATQSVKKVQQCMHLFSRACDIFEFGLTISTNKTKVMLQINLHLEGCTKHRRSLPLKQPTVSHTWVAPGLSKGATIDIEVNNRFFKASSAYMADSGRKCGSGEESDKAPHCSMSVSLQVDCVQLTC